jgi:hypothetical protein
MKPLLALVLLALFTCPIPGHAEPWSESPNCRVAPRGTEGLLPQAKSALGAAGADHRITRSLDRDPGGANYHGPDATIENRQFTAAVDISVRCVDEEGIKELLGRLAQSGFAAWYRKNGKDSWKGNNHIHAVWAAEPLKRQLRGQVASWLAGRTGLVGDAKYSFWQPSEDERAVVKSAYEASKPKQ